MIRKIWNEKPGVGGVTSLVMSTTTSKGNGQATKIRSFMGWCSGDRLCAEVWMEVRSYLPDEIRKDVLKRLVRIFEGEDMDCYDSIMETPEGEAALKELHPD